MCKCHFKENFKTQTVRTTRVKELSKIVIFKQLFNSLNFHAILLIALFVFIATQTLSGPKVVLMKARNQIKTQLMKSRQNDETKA